MNKCIFVQKYRQFSCPSQKNIVPLQPKQQNKLFAYEQPEAVKPHRAASCGR